MKFFIPECPQLIITTGLLYVDTTNQWGKAGCIKNNESLMFLVDKLGGRRKSENEFYVEPGIIIKLRRIISYGSSFDIDVKAHKKYNPGLPHQIDFKYKDLKGIEYELHV